MQIVFYTQPNSIGDPASILVGGRRKHKKVLIGYIYGNKYTWGA